MELRLIKSYGENWGSLSPCIQKSAQLKGNLKGEQKGKQKTKSFHGRHISRSWRGKLQKLEKQS